MKIYKIFLFGFLDNESFFTEIGRFGNEKEALDFAKRNNIKSSNGKRKKIGLHYYLCDYTIVQ